MVEVAAIKKKGNIIPEFNHLKNLIFLLITLGIALIISYLKINKLTKGVNDLFIFINYRSLAIFNIQFLPIERLQFTLFYFLEIFR